MVSGGNIVTEGRRILLDRTYNTFPSRTVVSKFKVGIGTTDVTLTDTDLENAVPIAGIESVDSCDVSNFTDSTDMTTSLNITNFTQGTASLNLTKDGITSINANTQKTTISLNFTSKKLSISFFSIDQTAVNKLASIDAITVRLGSDSSNYFQWTRDRSQIINIGGFTFFQDLNSTNADSTTGSPVLTAMDFFFIQLTATSSAITWSAGDFAMDDIKLISTDDFIKSFETGYPSLDFTNIQAEIRCRLSTVQANGYPITEFGIFNTDGTPLMKSRDTFNAISKSDDDEIIFVSRTLIE